MRKASATTVTTRPGEIRMQRCACIQKRKHIASSGAWRATKDTKGCESSIEDQNKVNESKYKTNIPALRSKFFFIL